MLLIIILAQTYVVSLTGQGIDAERERTAKKKKRRKEDGKKGKKRRRKEVKVS